MNVLLQEDTTACAVAEQQSVIRKSSQTLVQAGGQIREANPVYNTTSRTKHSLMLTHRGSFTLRSVSAARRHFMCESPVFKLLDDILVWRI